MSKWMVAMKTQTTSVALLLLVSAIWGVAACSSPDSGQGNTTGPRRPPVNTRDAASPVADASVTDVDGGALQGGDVGTGGGAVDTGPDATGLDASGQDADLSDVREQDARVDGPPPEEVLTGHPCGDVVSIGYLDEGARSVTLQIASGNNRVATRCAGGARHEAVLALRIPDVGRLRVQPSVAAAVEFRHDPCDVDDRALVCTAGAFEREMAPGPLLYLVVEALDANFEGALTLEIDWQSQAICPREERGTSRCTGEQSVEICEVTFASIDVPRLYQANCSTPCVQGRCRGNSCANPMVVLDRVDVQGDYNALFDSHNSYEVASCGTNGIWGADTAGQDLVFEVLNASRGERIRVDLSRSGNPHTVLIKSTCGSDTDCLALFENAEQSGEVVWEVPQAGTYFVIVDSPLLRPQGYDVSVERLGVVR